MAALIWVARTTQVNAAQTEHAREALHYRAQAVDQISRVKTEYENYSLGLQKYCFKYGQNPAKGELNRLE